MTIMTEETTKTIAPPAPAAPIKGIQVTDKAIEKIRNAMVKEGISPAEGGLRLGVQGGGCSGLSYNIRFDTQPRERDRIFQFADVRVFVDPKVVHLPARHDPGLSGNADAAGLRIRESKFHEIVRLRNFVLRLRRNAGTSACGKAPGSFTTAPPCSHRANEFRQRGR